MSEGTGEREGLLRLIPPGEGDVRVLAIESLFYLPELCRMLPRARVSVVTDCPEAAGISGYRDLDVEWHFLDFRREALPFPPDSFDIVLGEPCLTLAFEPYETLAGIARLIRDTGYLVTEFENIRYWRVLERLMQGFFPERERRLYAKTEVVPLLSDASFKEIFFSPLRRDETAGGAEEWEARGFENFSGDLSTEAWMVRAFRSDSAAAALKALYTRQVRAEISRLLHRIEYDVERGRSLARLWQLCREQAVFDEYLGDFAREVMVHSDALELLYREGMEHGMDLREKD